MNRTDVRRLLALAAFAVTVSCVVPGCSPRNDRSGSPPPQSDTATRSSLEIECERELLYLDNLIESRRRDPGFQPGALAEAVALRQSAAELVLDEEFELALELIDEAIALLREL